jgi:6-phosphogluconolactonase (cycloisomerase 2 family)
MRESKSRSRSRERAILGAAVAIVALTVSSSSPRAPELTGISGRLVSIQELQTDFGDMRYWEPGDAPVRVAESTGNNLNNLFDAFDDAAYAAGQSTGGTSDLTRPPVRTIRDTYPIYSSIAVDTQFNEVALQDTNLFGIKVFDRLENTPREVESSKPKRVIEGAQSDLEYNNGLYIDPKNGDIYSVASDTADNMIVFPRDAQGNVAPARKLKTPHRNFATAVDEEKGEVFITIQYPPKVVVYRKGASGDDKPIRVLEGEHTGIYDAHGVAIDVQKKLLFVSSWGNASDYKVAGTGKFYAPSITVFPLDASGDTAPLRTIQGPKTQLDWAAAMSIDPDGGFVFLANDVGDSVIAFRETDQGNVAPARILKGPKTGLKNPTGVAVDSKNKELWVSSLGNSSATAYPLSVNGDAAPLRTIRSAPLGRRSVKFGKPQAIAYDSKREQYLVPN